jgi:hypothetical protein
MISSSLPEPARQLLTTKTRAERAELYAASVAGLWARGDVRHVLDSNQETARAEIAASGASRYVLEWSRRTGKTWLLVALAIEECLRGRGRRVVYGAPTVKDLEEFIHPTFEAIQQTCPEHLRATYSADSGHWTFPNGSYVHLFGCDDKRKANRGRGPAAQLAIVDEAGFIPILGYVLRSIIRPQLLTTGGRLIIGSTPAEEPDHDFTSICERAEALGHWSRKTLYDNPRLTPERISEFIAEDARDEGMTVEEYQATAVFRREYMAERVTDKTLAAMGDDWETMREASFVEVPRPAFFDAYTTLDVGGADPHAVLFGYVDFERGWLVVEDEILMRDGQNTQEIADAIKQKERQLYGVHEYAGRMRGAEELGLLAPTRRIEWQGAPDQPYLRVCDNDLTMVADLHQLHGIAFVPVGAKDEKQWMVNHLRVLLRAGRVRIHPRCKHLDRHLRTTLWRNEVRSEFRRKDGEHGDLLDCLIYFARRANFSRNPYPANHDLLPGMHRVHAGRIPKDSRAEELANVMYAGNALARRLRGGR